METKYIIALSQFHHLLHLSDLSLSSVFPLLSFILLSFIIFVIIIYYSQILRIKKLLNIDHLISCYSCTNFVLINSINTRAELTFDSIFDLCKSSFRILGLTKEK